MSVLGALRASSFKRQHKYKKNTNNTCSAFGKKNLTQVEKHIQQFGNTYASQWNALQLQKTQHTYRKAPVVFSVFGCVACICCLFLYLVIFPVLSERFFTCCAFLYLQHVSVFGLCCLYLQCVFLCYVFLFSLLPVWYDTTYAASGIGCLPCVAYVWKTGSVFDFVLLNFVSTLQTNAHYSNQWKIFFLGWLVICLSARAFFSCRWV